MCTCVCACVCLINHKVSAGSICKGTVYGWEKLTRHCYLDQSVNRSTPCMGIKRACKITVPVCVHMRVCMCVLNHKVSVGSICKRTGYGCPGKARHCYLDQSTHSVHRSTPCMGIKELVKKQYLCVCVCVCVCAHACVHVCAC